MRKHSQQDSKQLVAKHAARQAHPKVHKKKMEETASFNLLMDQDFRGSQHFDFDGEHHDSFDSLAHGGNGGHSDDLRARRPEFYKDRVLTTEQELRKTIPDFTLPNNSKETAYHITRHKGPSEGLDHPEQRLDLDETSLQKLGKEQYS